MKQPLLAVTMGDPTGIGPEVLVKALAGIDRGRKRNRRDWVPLVYGQLDNLRAAAACFPQSPDWVPVAAPQQAREVSPPGVAVLPLAAGESVPTFAGKVSPVAGRIAVTCFEAAVRDALAGRVQGIVTCPLNKEAVQAAGFAGDTGHQEILARMTGAELTATLLMTGGLKVVHLSTHKPLAEAVAYVRKPILVAKLRLALQSLRSWGLPRPVLAVAALNPHGGEGGMLGREELDEIAPAVRQLAAEGEAVCGPFPADSVFYRAAAGEFDAVMALYHDQGHIAIKMHNFAESVTATLGIPFVRTSVDHGTAFDIAGRGCADETSLVRALEVAVDMLHGRLK